MRSFTAILVGDFKPDAAVALAERYFGRIPANPKGVPEVITLEPPQPALAGILGGAPTFMGRGPGGMRPPSGRLHKALVLDQKIATAPPPCPAA